MSIFYNDLINAFVQSISKNQGFVNLFFQSKHKFVIYSVLVKIKRKVDYVKLVESKITSLIFNVVNSNYICNISENTWTNIRFEVTHVCPVFLNLDAIQPLTAKSISAESKTINGAFPPSSSETFFTVLAHCSYNILPKFWYLIFQGSSH